MPPGSFQWNLFAGSIQGFRVLSIQARNLGLESYNFYGVLLSPNPKTPLGEGLGRGVFIGVNH